MGYGSMNKWLHLKKETHMRKNLLLLGLGLSLSGALMAADVTRSLPAAPGGAPQQPTTGVVYGKTAYVQSQPGQAGYLYLGISKAIAAPVVGATDNRTYTLSRGIGGDDGAVLQAVLTPPFKLNGADQIDLSIKCAGKVVNNLTLLRDLYPVVTVTGDPSIDPIDQIWVFDTSSSPLNILTNDTDNINDASGIDAITQPIRALATALTPVSAPTAFYVFAAVSAKDKEFKTDTSGTGDGVNRGIAIIRLGTNKLDVLNCGDFSSTVGKAAELSLLPANGIVSFVDPGAIAPITTAELASNDVAMWYDNAHLQRLYIGLSGVKRDDPTKEGGVLSLVMARIVQNGAGKDANLLVQSCFAGLNQDMFFDLSLGVDGEYTTNGVVGFYGNGDPVYKGDRDMAISTRHIRTMHTSTGYDYVILNTVTRSSVSGASGLVIGDDTSNQVYALPVAPNNSNVNPTFVGQIVKVKTDGTPDGYNRLTGVYSPIKPDDYTNMPTAQFDSVKVGAGLNLEIVDGTYVSEMVVAGDAVYVTLDGPNNHNAGIYQSSALFNQFGFIRAWTPWQRVMGDMRRVMGMGLSSIDGTYTFLTTQLRTDLTTTNTFNTVRATSWGKTSDVTVQDPTVENIAADNLGIVLETLFPQSEGGVLGLQSFDEYTTGFARGRFAMMIAFGTRKVALIKTGEFVGGEFKPVTTFNTTGVNQNVFVFDAADTTTTRGTALGAIAPLTCAVVATHATGQGWVFVGGRGGIAVLSTDASGEGFVFTPENPVDGLVTLSRDGVDHNEFPGGTKFSFKQLMPTNLSNSFARTRSLAVAHNYLSVMTFDAAYNFELAETKFERARSGPHPAPLQETVTATPANAKLNDMLLVAGTDPDGLGDRILFATTKGLGYSDFDTAAFVNTGLSSPVFARLAYLGQDRLSTSKVGNLYALVQNLTKDKDSTYRFDVRANGDALRAQDVYVIKESGSTPTQYKSYIDFDQARSGILPVGSFLYSTRSEDFGETEFLKLHKISGATAVTSDLTSNLDVDTDSNVLVEGLMREGASGTLMLPADWGVRVNQ